PGEAADLNAVLPQLRFYNIYAGYLGTDGWAEPELLSRSQAFLNGAVFASPEYHHLGNRRWSNLLATWRSNYGGEPDIVAARTFDAIILTAQLLTEGIPPSGSSTDTPTFEGASGKIIFSPIRENVHVPLYGYYNGHIVPTEEIPRPTIEDEITDY
ncbi:MAG: hypothetical protein GY869_16000, partial [Planctomycetes bacterium]|nr:hypothetical protein [Planctomycetota bacterium]